MGKRFAIVIGVAALGAAVALSATALAGADGYHSYRGQVKHGPGRVRFSANLQRRRVRDMRFRNVNLTCDQGTVKYSARMRPRKKRTGDGPGDDLVFRFRDTFEHGASTLEVFVGGTIIKSRHSRKAFGNIQITGDLDASHTNCNKVNGRPQAAGAPWVAHRG